MLIQTPKDTLMHTGDSVSFLCHINVSSGWNFKWYKDRRPLSVSGDSYNISFAVTSNSGSYQCQVSRKGTSDFHSDQTSALELQIKGQVFVFLSL